jgi:hypothetical protein
MLLSAFRTQNDTNVLSTAVVAAPAPASLGTVAVRAAVVDEVHRGLGAPPHPTNHRRR